MMRELEVPDECGVCGDELDGEYEVKQYEVENPTESGYLNPFGAPGVTYHLPQAGPHELHLPVCKHCDAPETPPVPETRPNLHELLHSGLFSVFFAFATVSPPASFAAVDVASTAFFAVVLGVVAVGEYLQIARIREREKPRWEREWDVDPVLADDEDADPVTDAREAFLAGEIDEAELEERLDEELGDTEERDRELLTEQ